MVRMLSLVAVAAASLGGAGLTPTPAAACNGGYRHDWCGPRVYFGPPVSFGYGNCYVRELLQTPWGLAGDWSTAAAETFGVDEGRAAGALWLIRRHFMQILPKCHLVREEPETIAARTSWTWVS